MSGASLLGLCQALKDRSISLTQCVSLYQRRPARLVCVQTLLAQPSTVQPWLESSHLQNARVWVYRAWMLIVGTFCVTRCLQEQSHEVPVKQSRFSVELALSLSCSGCNPPQSMAFCTGLKSLLMWSCHCCGSVAQHSDVVVQHSGSVVQHIVVWCNTVALWSSIVAYGATCSAVWPTSVVHHGGSVVLRFYSGLCHHTGLSALCLWLIEGVTDWDTSTCFGVCVHCME